MIGTDGACSETVGNRRDGCQDVAETVCRRQILRHLWTVGALPDSRALVASPLDTLLPGTCVVDVSQDTVRAT
jgi:hypothetical protein